MLSETLVTKYRPSDWSEVIGHKAVVKSLRDACEQQTGRAFMFTGQRGVGKTTLAYLVARAYGATASTILDVNGANYTGVDDMRTLTAGLDYRPLEDDVQVILIDEAHRLSKQAQDALLKPTEVIPDWVVWIFCTTNPGAIIKTLRSRFLTYDLPPVGRDDLFDLLDSICNKEKLDVDDGVLDVCVKNADGSARQAIANLGVCAVASDRREAAGLLRVPVDGETDSKLASILVKNPSWELVREEVTKLVEAGTDLESVRYQVIGYVSKVVLGTKDGKKADALLSILDAFAEPFDRQAGNAPLLLACGRVLFT